MQAVGYIYIYIYMYIYIYTYIYIYIFFSYFVSDISNFIYMGTFRKYSMFVGAFL